MHGNGLSEARSFSARFFSSEIEVPGRPDQVYTTDAVGNITSQNRAVGPDHFLMTYTYQAPQYFLAQGNGPWGQQEWSYDRIGNRLSEVMPGSGDPPSGETFTSSYLPNPGGGNTPKLAEIEPAPGGDPGSFLTHGFDLAGNQTTVAASSEESVGRTSFLDYSAESRLAQLHTSDGTGITELLYDGRGFLRRSRLTFSGSTDFEQTEPVYSSEGLLLARSYHKHTRGGRGDTGEPPTTRVVMDTTYLLYFAGRPVAQLKRPPAGGGPDELLFLTADHLGTPILATDSAGATVWEGGLSPFGAPFVFSASPPPGEEEDPPPPEEGGDNATARATASATATMEGAGIFLRFPGQWDDPSFRSHGLRGGLYYNVHRWYEVGPGRYSQLDPEWSENALGGVIGLPLSPYTYADLNPVRRVDLIGLLAFDPIIHDSCKEAFTDEGVSRHSKETLRRRGTEFRTPRPASKMIDEGRSRSSAAIVLVSVALLVFQGRFVSTSSL